MKKIKSIFAIIVLMLLYTACGSAKNSHDNASEERGYVTPSSDYGMQSETNDESKSFSTSESQLPENEKFIVRTTLHVETENFDESVKVIEKMTSELKGYMESVDASYGTM